MVLDSSPDQCAKDHTSTEIPVSHATYDSPNSMSQFPGLCDVEAGDAGNPRRKPRTRLIATAAPLCNCHRPGPGSHDRRMLYGCISRFSYMPPGPSRSRLHSTAGASSETLRSSETRPMGGTLMGCCVSFHRTMGHARVGSCTGQRHGHYCTRRTCLSPNRDDQG